MTPDLPTKFLAALVTCTLRFLALMIEVAMVALAVKAIEALTGWNLIRWAMS